MLRLFDEIERDSQEPAKYSESQYNYLNRSARTQFAYLRELLEIWFSEFQLKADGEKSKQFQANFRSDDDIQHIAAFFELYLFKLFSAMGFDVEVEPDWEGRKPDFLFMGPNGKKLLVEATGCYTDSRFASDQQRLNVVLDAINDRVSSPYYFLDLSINSFPKNNVAYAKLTRKIQAEIDKLDYEDVRRHIHKNGLTTYDLKIRHYGWDVDIKLWPRNTIDHNEERIIGIQWLPTYWVPDKKNIFCEKVEDKSNKYAVHDIPYIIAINFFDIDFRPEQHLANWLIGDLVSREVPNQKSNINHRKMNGVWLHGEGFRLKHVSGVLIFKMLEPSSFPWKDATLWHHPRANHPIDPQSLPMNHMVYDDATGDFIAVRQYPIVQLLDVELDKLRD